MLACNGFASISFEFYAFSKMVLADASVIVFTSPVITFFFGACLLEEKIDCISFICALGSFGGLVCVARPAFLFGHEAPETRQHAPWMAIISAFMGAIGQAFVFICVRKLHSQHTQVIIHYFMLFSTLCATVLVLGIEQGFTIPRTGLLWLCVLGSGLLTFMGQMLLTKGFQLEKAGIASVMRNFDMVCVFLWDSLLLHEPITHWSILGATTVFCAAILIALRKAATSKL